jgi:hypothetical protein
MNALECLGYFRLVAPIFEPLICSRGSGSVQDDCSSSLLWAILVFLGCGVRGKYSQVVKSHHDPQIYSQLLLSHLGVVHAGDVCYSPASHLCLIPSFPFPFVLPNSIIIPPEASCTSTVS